MLKKLKLKFVLVIMGLVTVLFGTVFGYVMHQTKENIARDSIQMMRSLSFRPWNSAPGFKPDNKPEDKPENKPGEKTGLKPEDMPEMKPEENRNGRRQMQQPQSQIRLLFYSVRLSSGGEILESEGNDEALSDSELLQKLTDIVLAKKEQSGILSGYDLRYLKEERGNEQAIVFADISGEKAMLRGLIRNILLGGILGYAAFFVISLLLANWVARPVEQTWNEQKQFIADASHELKTPLTVIITNAEMLGERNYSETEREGFTKNILSMSQRMRGLVESLLELARMDNRQSAPEFRTLDFSRLINDCILPFEPLFYENETELQTDIEPDIRIEGDKEKLRQVMTILLDNALKYDDRAYPVQIRLKRQAGHCLLSVSGMGAPLSKADCKNIFKRFYRVDPARSGSNGQSYGLGLAIAESIIRAHNGRIWAESSDRCNTFYLSLTLSAGK